jgi:hypothetical protein
MTLIAVRYLHLFIVLYIGVMRLITCLLSSTFYCTLYRSYEIDHCYLHLFIVLYIGVMNLITVCYLHLFIVLYIEVL